VLCVMNAEVYSTVVAGKSMSVCHEDLRESLPSEINDRHTAYPIVVMVFDS
jgi:hypothetical protein